MEIIVKGLIIAIFIAICCYFIIKNINTALLEKKKELKKHRIIRVGIGLNIHIQMVQTMRMIQRML